MEEFSDIEGEEPYYPESERVYVTTTRSGREVYTPRRLIVEEHEEVSSDGEGPSSIDTQSTDATYLSSGESESDEEEEEEESDTASVSTPPSTKITPTPTGDGR